MKSSTRTRAAVSLCLIATPLFAQTDIEEIQVVANRLQQPADVVMAATTVIDKDSIRRSMAQNLAELLSGLPGMQLAPSGGQGAQTSLFLRGTESDHTLILVDGIQMSTSTGSAGRLEFIPLDQIERIEIVRGPRSSVYGSEAIGGVMNIITRPRVEEEFVGNLSIMAGTENSSDANLSLQGKIANTALSLNASHRETDGISFAQDGNPDDDGHENDSVAVSVEQKFNDLLSLTASYSGFETLSEYDDGEVHGDSQQLAAALQAIVTEQWHTSLTTEQFKEDNLDVGGFGTTQSRSENRRLSWQNSYTLDNRNLLAFGLDRQEQELHYRSFGAVQSQNSRDNDGLYGMYVYDGNPLDLTLSLRNDDNEHFGSHSTGSIAVGWEASADLRTWVSYGTAFKAPNLIDLYVDFPSFFFFSNPDLEPETSENIEVGLHGTTAGAQWQINVFRNNIDDLIAADATFSTLANVQKARIDGLEVSVSRTIASWQMDLALTLLDHENRSTGKALVRRPDQTLSLNLAREFGDFDVMINVLGQGDHADIDPNTFGPSTVGGYTNVTLVAGYRLTDAAHLRLRVGNLFDRDYQIVDGFNTYGRTAQLSFDYRF